MSDEQDRDDESDDQDRAARSWKEKHGGTIIAVAAFAMLVTLTVLQMSC